MAAVSDMNLPMPAAEIKDDAQSPPSQPTHARHARAFGGVGGMMMSVSHNQGTAELLAKANDEEQHAWFTPARIEIITNPFLWFQVVLCGSQVYVFGKHSIIHLLYAVLVEVGMVAVVLACGRTYLVLTRIGVEDDDDGSEVSKAIKVKTEMESSGDKADENDSDDDGMNTAIKTKVYADKVASSSSPPLLLASTNTTLSLSASSSSSSSSLFARLN
jgi:hypothetical protein